MSIAQAAGVAFDSAGFETPYLPGALNGQQGWVKSGNGATSATVQGTTVRSGSQAVTVNRAANSEQRFFVPLPNLPTQRFVTVDWDMRVSQPANLNGFGPFFGIDAYDETGTFGQLGSFGVDATTGDVLYQAASGALTEAGPTVAFNEWYHYRIVFDFGMDKYLGYVDGNPLSTSSFVDGELGLDQFTDADIAAFAAQPDPISAGLSASAVFDNFVIRDGLLGDYDIDGDVDNADYSTWKATFGATVTAGNNADGNKNGVVDAADYVIWRNNFGMSLFSGTSTGSALVTAAVPEPSSMLLVLCGLPALAGRMRRRLSLAVESR